MRDAHKRPPHHGHLAPHLAPHTPRPFDRRLPRRNRRSTRSKHCTVYPRTARVSGCTTWNGWVARNATGSHYRHRSYVNPTSYNRWKRTSTSGCVKGSNVPTHQPQPHSHVTHLTPVSISAIRMMSPCDALRSGHMMSMMKTRCRSFNLLLLSLLPRFLIHRFHLRMHRSSAHCYTHLSPTPRLSVIA